jgi:hypothetical protein
VIGLGTGSSAGWLAEVPGIERVDVVELEPAVLEVARRAAPVNRDVLENPRVRVTIGDARELLLTTRERYDLIVSEPSNPYRAGIASLFTREYYEAAASRLTDDGLFLQWLQAYEVGVPAVRGAYATLASVLPHLESWRTHTSDLLLVASREGRVYDAADLRARIADEPFKTALLDVWRATTLEGLLARFVAGPGLPRKILEEERYLLNTDDRNPIEFGFARTLGLQGLFGIDALLAAAGRTSAERPALTGGPVDLLRVEDERLAVFSGYGEAPPAPRPLSSALTQRAKAHARWAQRDRPGTLAAWRGQGQEPAGPTETALVAEATADAGDDKARAYIDALRTFQPAEADACLGRLLLRQGQYDDALAALEAAFIRYRSDPWPAPHVMQGALDAALELAVADSSAVPRLLQALGTPFALEAQDDVRHEVAFLVAGRAGGDPGPECLALVEGQEPNVPWTEPWLSYRARCYAIAKDPRADAAERDLARFRGSAAESLLAQ